MAVQFQDTDVDLVDGLARRDRDALRKIWDRYARAMHWVCALYEEDAELVPEHLEVAFLALWTSSPAALRARPLPEHLAATTRSRCRAARRGAPDPRPTIQRLDRLSDPELAGVALLFSGEFSAHHVIGILGCDRGALGRSLHTVLAGDVDREGRASSTRKTSSSFLAALPAHRRLG